jgi:hypothetical protein
MTGNVYGVRYEERNSKAILTRNDITGNKVGIFCVMESPGQIVIRENRIHGNTSYDFKLGNRQRMDIPNAEPELGRVLFEPFLAMPPPVIDRYWN